MPSVGNLWTNTPWGVTAPELRAEFKRWGVTDYSIPTFAQALAAGKVTIEYMLRGVPTQLEACLQKVGRYDPPTTLRALLEVVRATRLADQRGIGGLLAKATARLALPPSKDERPHRTPRQILGVPEGLDDRRLMELAWRDLRKKMHPETPGGSETAFKEVEWAARELGLLASPR